MIGGPLRSTHGETSPVKGLHMPKAGWEAAPTLAEPISVVLVGFFVFVAFNHGIAIQRGRDVRGERASSAKYMFASRLLIVPSSSSPRKSPTTTRHRVSRWTHLPSSSSSSRSCCPSSGDCSFLWPESPSGPCSSVRGPDEAHVGVWVRSPPRECVWDRWADR